MVIGKGMVARRFASYEKDDRFVIFASGVSNSKNRIIAEYSRETDLLKSIIEAHKEKILVYFSTCSVYDPEEKNSPYILHKYKAENIVQSYSQQFYVFRVSNLVGKSDNPNTILNFFVYHAVNKINFDLWSNAVRNLVGIDDMYRIIDYISNYKVTEIVKTIEEFWQIEANYVSIAKGSSIPIDLSIISPIIQKLNIQFGENYLVNLLEKYYKDK